MRKCPFFNEYAVDKNENKTHPPPRTGPNSLQKIKFIASEQFSGNC
jgi:hypothetical protein